MLRLIAAVAVTVLASCAAPSAEAPPQASETPPAPYQCILPSEQRMLVAELFFGRDKAGRKAVSDAEWADFLAKTVTPYFPDGLTVFDGYGQWRNPETGLIGRSPSVKIVLIAAKRSPDLAGRLNTVMEAYKTRFHQQSIGIITRDSCAAF
jgi:hypothetical protein